LFFWDADTLLLPDAILKLLQRGLPVVSGLYLQRGVSHRPVVLDMKVEGRDVGGLTYLYQSIEDVPDDGRLIECGVTPGGIFLVERSVFEKIQPPWFAFPKKAVGEDIYFSCRLQTAGYKQYVDTSVEGIHLVQHPAASREMMEAWAKAYGYEITRPT
jgi:cellulose synthase/poly-beta-1,6-N-acetylglucosamine synthase-like glycosyltransferase